MKTLLVLAMIHAIITVDVATNILEQSLVEHQCVLGIVMIIAQLDVYVLLPIPTGYTMEIVLVGKQDMLLWWVNSANSVSVIT